jgi:GT2 family glycosyltransferase
MKVKLSVIIVNYRSWEDVARLVTSLSASLSVISGEAEIVVVDNDSRQPIPALISKTCSPVRLLVQPENGGFSAGVNAGWRESSGRWLLVLNPDISADSGLVERVLSRIRRIETSSDRAPGVVGFGLRYGDGSHQPSVGSYPTLARTVREQFLPRSRRKYQPDRKLRPGRVDWVTGACMLLNRELMDDLGGMDEDFFLYYEEVALCRSASRRGWRVEYDPEVSVAHLDPLQNRPISPKMRAITRHSKLLYFRKHLPTWQYAVLVATIRLEARFRSFLSMLQGRTVEARSWRLIGRMASQLAAGERIVGREVRLMAESLDDPPEDPGPVDFRSGHVWAGFLKKPMSPGSRRTRPVRPGKDGSR